MAHLLEILPNVDDLLRLCPEELAWQILSLANEHKQNGLIHLQAIAVQIHSLNNAPDSGYPQNRRKEAELAIAEAWSWLIVNGLLVPEPGINGNNGHMLLTRQGVKVVQNQDAFEHYKKLINFPIHLLHPTIADTVWSDIARGDLDTAVFKSFKAVEVAVREVGGFDKTDIGVQLMRKAFDKDKGPLSDMNQTESEREALAHLFAGGIGSYKNPHSHRTVTIADPLEAQEMVTLASHLLRIVDSRKPQKAKAE